MMASLVFLSSPVDESVGAYSILSFVSPPQVTNLGLELIFNAASTNQQQMFLISIRPPKHLLP